MQAVEEAYKAVCELFRRELERQAARHAHELTQLKAVHQLALAQANVRAARAESSNHRGDSSDNPITVLP